MAWMSHGVLNTTMCLYKISIRFFSFNFPHILKFCKISTKKANEIVNKENWKIV